jgi:chloride channel 3/4/5
MNNSSVSESLLSGSDQFYDEEEDKNYHNTINNNSDTHHDSKINNNNDNMGDEDHMNSSLGSSSISSSPGLTLNRSIQLSSFDDEHDIVSTPDYQFNNSRARANSHLSEYDYSSGPLLSDYHEHSSTIRKDYTTLDWNFSKYSLHRMRRLLRLENLNNPGWKGRLKYAYIQAQAWIVLLLVGVLTAFAASIIHLVSEWLSDLKEGYCSVNWSTTRRVCCMDSLPVCSHWIKWDQAVLGYHANNASTYWWNYFMYIILTIPMACAASWLVNIYAKRAAGSGISEIKTILGGFIIKKFLGIRTLIIKSIALILAVSAGLHLGKEGPLVHIACCLGNIVSRKFVKYNSNEVKKREILSASAAAGVSAAFGSPIGGVLFSLESVSSYFPPKTMWRSFWCSITAAIVIQYMDPFQTGKLVQFAVKTSKDQWNWFELPLFALLGCLGGFTGAMFIRLNLKVVEYRHNSEVLRNNPIFDVFLLSVITAIINYVIIYTRGSSSTLLAQLFSGCKDLTITDEYDISNGEDSVINNLCSPHNEALSLFLLILAGIIKYILTILTYGSNVPSGVFMPALTIGACFGRSLGWMIAMWHSSIGDVGIFSSCIGRTSCINPGLYAIVGAAAMLGGITRLTVALTVIMFEVTGGLEYIIPIMISVVCSKWIGDAFGKKPLYARLIESHGYPYIDANAEIELDGVADDIMTSPDTTVCLLLYNQTLRDIKNILAQYPYHGFPIVNNEQEKLIYGYIPRSELELAIERAEDLDKNPGLSHLNPVHFSTEPCEFSTMNFYDFSMYIDKYPILVRPDEPLDRVLGLFQSLGLRLVLVCDIKGHLLGLIKKKDLLLHLKNTDVVAV